jgi:radical SAM superfamily enzyme YgiQ (UPF0313 family)
MALDFEQGPIRPPSEARSLLIRVTRNCPWNRCEFCPVYKGTQFSRRTVQEIKRDIDTVKEIVDTLKRMSWQAGLGGAIERRLVEAILRDDRYTESYRSVAVWLYYGGESAFLQDANSLVMNTEHLVEAVSYLKETFPGLTRITSYARSSTLARKPEEDLRRLKLAGLNRIHVGLESGSDEVLSYVNKGVTSEQQIVGGQRVVAAGIELSEYVMPGLGGRRLSREHALETARVLNAIDPDFIRIRSLALPAGTTLREKWEQGEFERPSDEEMVHELRLFIDHLDGITSYVASDHILNLLEEVEGQLPEGKPALLSVIDRFLSLPPGERLLFQVGRRLGLFRNLSDREDPSLRSRAVELREELASRFGGDLEQAIRTLAERYI